MTSRFMRIFHENTLTVSDNGLLRLHPIRKENHKFLKQAKEEGFNCKREETARKEWEAEGYVHAYTTFIPFSSPCNGNSQVRSLLSNVNKSVHWL